jgi:hypothetical protein
MGPKGKKNDAAEKTSLSENDLPPKVSYVILNKQQQVMDKNLFTLD